MSGPQAPVLWEVVDPTSDAARQILTEYFDDIVGRYWGRPATPTEVATAMTDSATRATRTTGWQKS